MVRITFGMACVIATAIFLVLGFWFTISVGYYGQGVVAMAFSPLLVFKFREEFLAPRFKERDPIVCTDGGGEGMTITIDRHFSRYDRFRIMRNGS